MNLLAQGEQCIIISEEEPTLVINHYKNRNASTHIYMYMNIYIYIYVNHHISLSLSLSLSLSINRCENIFVCARRLTIDWLLVTCSVQAIPSASDMPFSMAWLGLSAAAFRLNIYGRIRGTFLHLSFAVCSHWCL